MTTSRWYRALQGVVTHDADGVAVQHDAGELVELPDHHAAHLSKLGAVVPAPEHTVAIRLLPHET